MGSLQHRAYLAHEVIALSGHQIGGAECEQVQNEGWGNRNEGAAKTVPKLHPCWQSSFSLTQIKEKVLIWHQLAWGGFSRTTCLQRGPHLDSRTLPGGAPGSKWYWSPLTATSPDSLLQQQPVVQVSDSVSRPRATAQLTFPDDLLSSLLCLLSSWECAGLLNWIFFFFCLFVLF